MSPNSPTAISLASSPCTSVASTTPLVTSGLKHNDENGIVEDSEMQKRESDRSETNYEEHDNTNNTNQQETQQDLQVYQVPQEYQDVTADQSSAQREHEEHEEDDYQASSHIQQVKDEEAYANLLPMIILSQILFLFTDPCLVNTLASALLHPLSTAYIQYLPSALPVYVQQLQLEPFPATTSSFPIPDVGGLTELTQSSPYSFNPLFTLHHEEEELVEKDGHDEHVENTTDQHDKGQIQKSLSFEDTDREDDFMKDYEGVANLKELLTEAPIITIEPEDNVEKAENSETQETSPTREVHEANKLVDPLGKREELENVDEWKRVEIVQQEEPVKVELETKGQQEAKDKESKNQAEQEVIHHEVINQTDQEKRVIGQANIHVEQQQIEEQAFKKEDIVDATEEKKEEDGATMTVDRSEGTEKVKSRKQKNKQN